MKLSKDRNQIDRKEVENILIEDDLRNSKYKENCNLRWLINVLTNAQQKSKCLLFDV